MRSPAAGAEDRGVEEREIREIAPVDAVAAWLEVDLAARPIEGTLRPVGRRPRPFVGWLGLTTAIERLRPSRDEDHGSRKEGS